MKRVSILGATGSIGQSTLDLIAADPEAYEIVALTGGRNIAQLAADARRFGAQIAVTAHDDELPSLRDALAGTGIEAASGAAALNEAAARPVDWVCNGIIGAAGLQPGLAALAQGATLALANKESLVCAGTLVMATATAHGATLLPVDSEHSAIYQCLTGESSRHVARLQVTASGGAFRDWPLEALEGATPEQAATHPNWDMGQRITIDSASMFNKALELIEAKELFDLSPDVIEALIHPESLVHSLVTFDDGATLAHLGPADMRHAIGYALHWPIRAPLPLPPLDLAQVGQLTFRAPDETRYPALRLAREVMEAGGLHGAVLNAAKEEALDAFLAHRIRFTEMAVVVERTLDHISAGQGVHSRADALDKVLDMDAEARRVAQGVIISLEG
ncbi:MAG: 1-deoxy-D-xylulose-5-phosphate reductoisomerase [Rhodobacterales bacterium]|nr:MAG: 1-deoxy-D-xylulose-5-phosphate reductoisomerase [Rhodobacterales bacterium]